MATCQLRGFAQGGTWTWMRGSNTAASTGNYGTKGVASATNEPPARYEASYWTDLQGNFWLFGGSIPIGLGATVGNDLWKYDVATNMWTWVNGPNVVSAPSPGGVYGTKGIPSVNNYPPAGGLGAACWTDNAGDLWLYAGVSISGFISELWKYNIATNQWTWMYQGTLAPVLGTKGVASANNNPGPITEINCGWVDRNNCLWMFGGNNSNGDRLNTMWKYDISSGLWTWMSGSTVPNAPGSYGVKGVETATNEPPSRFSYSRWKDGDGNFYVFGGAQYYSLSTNDVWRYRPAVNQWTWVAGMNVPDDMGNYPAQYCTFSDTHYPRARNENTTPATAGSSCAGTLWMFGGAGQSIPPDLWLFRTDSMKWAQISGGSAFSVSGTYGTRGVPSPANLPPSRCGHANWMDKKYSMWVFGGSTNTGFANDLWRFTPDTACIDVRVLFEGHLTPPDTSICPGDSSFLQIGMHTSVRYSPATGVKPNSDTSRLVFRPAATTSYQVVINGRACSASDTLRFTIRVNARDSARLKPPTPLILCKGDTAVMSVNPGWSISVTPNTGVSYLATGGTKIRFFPTAPSTQYRVTAASNQSCIYPDTIRFSITRDTATLHIPLMADTLLCPGDTAVYTLNQKVDAWSVSPAGGFSVNKDTTVFRFFPETSTTYRFTGIKLKGCNPRDTMYFKVQRSKLKAGFILTPKVASTNAAHFTLRNTSVGADRYQWYVNGNPFSTQDNPSYTADDSGRYCFLLLATDTLLCTDTAQDCADVVGELSVYLPSAFTPNGDGINDMLFVRGRGIQSIHLAIYNRWGQRVFESNSISQGWDGRFNGKEQDMDVYGYVLKATFVDGSTVSKTGNISMIK